MPPMIAPLLRLAGAFPKSERTRDTNDDTTGTRSNLGGGVEVLRVWRGDDDDDVKI